MKLKAKIRNAATLAWQGANNLLWPAVCINCRESISETDGGLCRNCWGDLLECTGGDYCRRCGRDASKFALIDGACGDCQTGRFAFDRIARAGVYAKSLKEMIVGLKRGRTELDLVLGSLADSALQGGGFSSEIELLVPVPLHWSRRLVRGYNQSLVLAKKLRHERARINTDLVRVRRTRFQPTMQTAAARARNVKGAFAVRKGHGFAGRAVCLVDDIKTTGATLNECAKMLKEAGASKVFALVLSVAGQSLG
ncbi:MAG: ComF family protein [Sedimentisphaerales bacterium]|nr:ComF family protein [Sedimentisphaerales bacterium]